ncbi:helix-turn-helix domain-containing protein [Salinigranum sp. GCM10025319]|uniref:helix-turn-helix domain-containing protein n=1 Tax=Salinigranum sp. GCM10025319 TaxID=3252687 RepID=UPI003616106E
MSDGIHAQLALRPREDCPLGRVVAEYAVRRLVPAQGETPPQVVLEADPAEAADDPALHAVEETKETVVCRLLDPDGEVGADVDGEANADADGDDGSRWSCGPCSARCPAAGFDHLPLHPYDVSVTDEWLQLSFAAVDESELRACLERLEALGRSVSLEALRADSEAEVDEARAVLVDLGDLTARQRETAALAVRQGYFESEGVSAGELADQLDVSKATVSEHLRAVRAKVGRQLFPDGSAHT